MKRTKLSHILFSLAVVAALILAAVPIMPAHALSSSSTGSTSISPTAGQVTVVASGAVVCRSITFWRNGHRITVRVCHRVHFRTE